MNIHEIYSFLLAGRTIQLEFPSRQEADRFRVSLAQLKMRQDKELKRLGYFTESDKQKLSFSMQTQLPPLEPILATIVFKDANVLRQYKVKIIEEETTGDETVSSNMGKDQEDR